MSTLVRTPEVRLDHATHEYFAADGSAVPGVSKILRGALKFAHVAPEVIERACQRGTAAHRAAALHLRGRLDQTTLAPEVQPYFAAFLRFQAATRFRAVHSERLVYSKRYGYAGTLDLAGFLPLPAGGEEAAVIDLKATAAVPATVGLQTAAYATALAEDDSRFARARRYCLHLKGNATYSLVPCDGSSDTPMFVNLVAFWRFCRVHKLAQA